MFRFKIWIWILIVTSSICISCAKGCVKTASKIKFKNRVNKNLKNIDVFIPNEIPEFDYNKSKDIDYNPNQYNYTIENNTNLNLIDSQVLSNNLTINIKRSSKDHIYKVGKTNYYKYPLNNLSNKKGLYINSHDYQKKLKKQLEKYNKPLKNETYQLNIDPIVKPKKIDLGHGLTKKKY